jgi:hypothetical protein
LLLFAIINPWLKGDDYKSSPAVAKFWAYPKEQGLHDEQFFRHRLIPKECCFEIVFGLQPILFDIFIGKQP